MAIAAPLKQIGTVRSPVPRQYPHLRPMTHADGQVHHRNDLRRSQRPAPPQHDVVQVLEWNGDRFADVVDRIEQVLDAQELKVPRTRCCSPITSAKAFAAAR